MSEQPHLNSDHVEIHGGIVPHLGSWRFFVDVVEKDGARIGMWDGATYDDAIGEAEALSKEFGPVVDLVAGAA